MLKDSCPPVFLSRGGRAGERVGTKWAFQELRKSQREGGFTLPVLTFDPKKANVTTFPADVNRSKARAP